MINFSIEQILFSIKQDTLFYTLCSGFVSSLLGGLVSGFITYYATTKTSKENIKNSQRNYIYKFKVELIFRFLQMALKVSGNLLSCIENQNTIKKICYQHEYYKNIKDLTQISFQLQIIADIYSDLKSYSKEIQDFYFKCSSIELYFSMLNNKAKQNNDCIDIDTIEPIKSEISRKNGEKEKTFKNTQTIDIFKEFNADIKQIENYLKEYIKKSLN